MESHKPYIILGICIGLTLVAVLIFLTWWLRNNPRNKRLLQKAKSLRIADVENGEYAKISGNVAPFGETLIAPLSGRECVYYKVTVEVGRAAMMEGDFSYAPLISETESVVFLLEQENDSAHIVLENYDSLIKNDFGYESDPTQEATPKLEAFLEKYGEQSKDANGYSKTLRYREAILEIGEEVAIKGVGFWEEDKNKTKKLILTGDASDNNKQLIISNDLS